MLTAQQVTSIATSINEKVNIPMLSEGREQEMMEQAINMINDQLDAVTAALPDSVKDIFNRVQDGITDAEAIELKAELVSGLNANVDIPFLGEGQEADMLISPAVDMIISTIQSVQG